MELCGRLFSHHIKLYSFMFIHKISTRVVGVNGKHPRIKYLVVVAAVVVAVVAGAVAVAVVAIEVGKCIKLQK